MDHATLTNLFRWSLQVALLTLVGAGLLRILRVEAPTLRHGFWRGLLLLCLALPLVQPWQQSAMLTTGVMETIEIPPASGIETTVTAGSPSIVLTRFLVHLKRTWPAWIGYILAAGAAARLIWLAVGVCRLRRLRKAGEPAAPGGGLDEVLGLIRAGAEIRYVPRLGQPVTFGVFRPLVLLPDSFPSLQPPLQRAVLAHELWHVRRRDWAWVLVEECIRAVFWFNPAIWWLVSQVQASREEVVDELTVQVTNARKVYLEALLTFADQPTLFPAAPFARRRHLFHRMLLISREAVMSSRKIVATSVAALAVVACTAWSGASAFPLLAPSAPAAAQNPPRDRRPGEAGPETSRERDLKAQIAANQGNKDLYLQLANLQNARGARSDAEATLESLGRAFSSDADVLTTLARAYAELGAFAEAVAALERATAVDPTNPQRHHLVGVFYWEKAFKDKSLTPDQVASFIKAGVAAEDRALAYSPDYVEALTYKNILLRMQANLEADPSARQTLLAEADELRNRAMQLNRARSATGAQGGVPGGVPGGVAGGVRQGPPPPPPPPPPPADLVDGVMPVRIGGELRPPRKLRDVKPIYPPEAMDAKVQGVVIIEAVINSAGAVVNTRVLRSLPMLDQAAIDAVSQWQFEPTLLNGAPVPVIMTVTVNFTLASD